MIELVERQEHMPSLKHSDLTNLFEMLSHRSLVVQMLLCLLLDLGLGSVSCNLFPSHPIAIQQICLGTSGAE